MPITANKIYQVTVSDDRLTATLAVNKDVPSEGISTEQIVDEVAALGIVIDDRGKKNITAFAAELAQGKTPPPIVVAQGKPPQHDQNGRIEKLYPSAGPQSKSETAGDRQDSKTSDNQSQSHYDRSDIINVTEGQELMRLIPPVAGNDGTDVFGKPVPRKLGRDVQIKLGQNVRQENDLILAASNGKVECTSEKIWVDDKLEIAGSVDFSVGNIDFDGEVEIRENVLDLFKVHSKSSISIHGIVEAAEVHAELDLNGIGGMAGKEKGLFSAGRDIKAKYITNARVRAGHDITVQSEIVHCNLICDGALNIENGPLVGGHIVATGGIKVKYLGSEAGVKTLVEVGIDETLRQKCQQLSPEVTLLRRKAEKVRQVVEPLLQNQKYLNSEQKEKATELLYNASELEEQAESLIEELRQVYQKAQEKAVTEIEVIGNIYSGVTIRFPRVEAIINMPLKGPLKILPRKVEGILRIVAVDSNSNTSRVLDTGATINELWDNLENLIGTK